MFGIRVEIKLKLRLFVTVRKIVGIELYQWWISWLINCITQESSFPYTRYHIVIFVVNLEFSNIQIRVHHSIT